MALSDNRIQRTEVLSNQVRVWPECGTLDNVAYARSCVGAGQDIKKSNIYVYINDIYVNEDIALVEAVWKHLKRYGLTSKDLEKFQNGARVLGQEVWLKNPHRRYMSKFRTGHITSIISPQSVIVNKTSQYVKDVYPQLNLGSLVNGGSDTSSENHVWQELGSNVCSSSTSSESKGEVLPCYVDSNSSMFNNSAREEEVTVLLQKSVRVKQPAYCGLCDHTISGVCDKKYLHSPDTNRSCCLTCQATICNSFWACASFL